MPIPAQKDWEHAVAANGRQALVGLGGLPSFLCRSPQDRMAVLLGQGQSSAEVRAIRWTDRISSIPPAYCITPRFYCGDNSTALLLRLNLYISPRRVAQHFQFAITGLARGHLVARQFGQPLVPIR